MDILKHINEQIDTRLPAGDMSGIKLRECQWTVTTAGPSPFNNERTELFFLGCKKAMDGNPCQGCFNSTTWDASRAQWTHDPVKMAEHINRNAPHKYITIGGGEPTDQIDNLIILCRELKKYDFHIMIYTWKDLKSILANYTIAVHRNGTIEHELINNSEKDKFDELLNYIDIVVDGQYKEEERLWDGTKGDGLISSIGSGNQIIWDIRRRIGFAMRDLDFIMIDSDDGDLAYFLKDNAVEIKLD